MSLEQECVHHWIIDSSNGSESDGICIKCKAEKSFRNSPEDHRFMTAKDRKKQSRVLR